MARCRLWAVIAVASLAGCGGGDDGDGLFGDIVGERGPHVPKAEQRALPTGQYSLADIACPPTYYDPKTAEIVRRTGPPQVRAFFRALREHPDHVVTATASLADPEPGEDRTVEEELTIGELGETFLVPLEDIGEVPDEVERSVVGAESFDCRIRLKAKLERLLEQSR